MKVLILSVMLIQGIAQAQEKLFLGSNYNLYKNSYLTIDKNTLTGFTRSFYDSYAHGNEGGYDGLLYPHIKYKDETVKDSLKGKVFFVENIKDSTHGFPVFKLVDSLTKKPVFYRYDPNGNSFPFLVSNIKIPDSYYCENLQIRVDDFTGEKVTETPSGNVRVHRHVNKGVTRYYISFTAYGGTINLNKTGLTILFSDGTKLAKPAAKIDCDPGTGSSWLYTAYIPITKAELKTISTKGIKKFRLYIYDHELPEKESTQLSAGIRCLIK